MRFCLVSRLQRSSFSRVFPPLLFLRRKLVLEQCDLVCVPFGDPTVFLVSLLRSHLHSLHQTSYTMTQVPAALGRRSGRYTPQAPRLTSSKMGAIRIKHRQHSRQTHAYVMLQWFGRLTIPRLFIARAPQLYMYQTCSPWRARAVELRACVRCQAQ